MEREVRLEIAEALHRFVERHHCPGVLMTEAPQAARIPMRSEITDGVEHHRIGWVKLGEHKHNQRSRINRRTGCEDIFRWCFPVRARGGENPGGFEI